MLNTEIVLTVAIGVAIIIIPLAVLFKWFLNHNIKLKNLELANNTFKELVPTRLQAYERLAILLERITPDTMVLRENKAGLTSQQLHQLLLNTVRQEFEHNLAMQIYLPSSSWERIMRSRDEVLKLISAAAREVEPSSSSVQLSTKIIEKGINETNFYIEKAKEALRSDIQSYYFD